MFSVIACIRDDHDWRLIVVATVVCLAGSVATMLLLERARRSAGSQRRLWIAVCACACGIGVWSTHFIAMLAYDGGIPIAYGAKGTSFSIAVAIAASWIAFSVGLAGGSRHAPAVGGLLLGLGIAAMHVTGMRAIEVQGRVAFDPETSFAAVLLGTSIATLALHSFQALRGVRGLAASILLLVVAICVLHFTSMSGVVLIPDPSVAATDVFDPFWLAGGVIAASTTLILMAFGALFVDRHLTDLKGLANASLEGMVILRGGEVIEVNERFVTLCGRKPAELIGRQRRELFAEAPGRRSPHDLGAGEGASEGELLHADGGYVPVERVCRTIEYKGRQCDVIFVRDLTARKDAERTIEHHHDALTDLSNRSSFDRRLKQALAAAVHHNEALAVLCLDLDRFKAVNDIFGHGEGDRILRKVADILRAAAERPTRSRDWAATSSPSSRAERRSRKARDSWRTVSSSSFRKRWIRGAIRWRSGSASA
jgi:PAS domain S-box-containing protein